jgi:phosphatidylserine/phosphatidylglycerophosphate/cardiolipin synthase-like enzyme
VVSPDTSRERLSKLIGAARKQLLIYDERVSDKLMLRLLRERAEAGVEIRVIGKVTKAIPGLTTRALADMRLHVRAIVADGATAFVGSQSLRKMELDERREIGVIVKDRRIVRKIAAVFEADWAIGKTPNGAVEDLQPGAALTASAAASG